MLETDDIRNSSSLWGTSLVLVQKEDGILIFCIDQCQLNVCTVKDPYALPRIDETLEYLNDAHISQL